MFVCPFLCCGYNLYKGNYTVYRLYNHPNGGLYSVAAAPHNSWPDCRGWGSCSLFEIAITMHNVVADRLSSGRRVHWHGRDDGWFGLTEREQRTRRPAGGERRCVCAPLVSRTRRRDFGRPACRARRTRRLLGLSRSPVVNYHGLGRATGFGVVRQCTTFASMGGTANRPGLPWLAGPPSERASGCGGSSPTPRGTASFRAPSRREACWQHVARLTARLIERAAAGAWLLSPAGQQALAADKSLRSPFGLPLALAAEARYVGRTGSCSP